jgi:hypothetical protein
MRIPTHTLLVFSVGAALVLAPLLTSLADAEAARRGGGGGGGVRASASGNVHHAASRPQQGNANRAANANVNHNANRNSNTNVNRNTNINRDVNIDRDIDVDIDGGCCHNDYWNDHPIATAAAITTTVAVTSAVIGSIVYSVPPSCVQVMVNGMAYQQCGSTWYQPQYAGTSVQYVVVNPPG